METDGGDGCTAMSMYLMLMSVYLKMAKLVNLLLWIFYHDNKKEGFIKKKKRN